MDNLGKDLANVEELRTSIITVSYCEKPMEILILWKPMCEHNSFNSFYTLTQDMMSSLCHDLNEIAHVLPNELHTMLQQEGFQQKAFEKSCSC